MKLNLQRLNDLTRSCRAAACAAALCLAGAFGGISEAASPVGVWDCITSGGGQRGIAYLTFSNNNTFGGFALVAGMPAQVAAAGNGRGGEDARSSDTNSLSSGTNNFVFGFIPLKGPWEFDNKGRVIGAFNEVLNVTSMGTNFVQGLVTQSITNLNDLTQFTNLTVFFANSQGFVITNYSWGSTNFNYTIVNTNFTLSAQTGEFTNSVSFTGVVAAGRRMTLVSSTTFGGRCVYSGVPAVPVTPSFDGTSWYGIKRQGGHYYNEFFSLHSFAGGNPFLTDFPGITGYPNIYYTQDGIGPSYGMSGVVVFSRQKRAGFVFNEVVGTNTTLRASFGGFANTPRLTRGNGTGIIEPGTVIGFSATLQP